MHRNDVAEIEIAFCRQRRRPAVHGEAVADRDQADFRAIQLADQVHVGKDRGVAGMIDAGAEFRQQDHAIGIAEIDRRAVDKSARRMQRGGEGDGKFAAGDHAAGIAGIDVFRALAGEIHADLEIGHDLRAGFLGDLRRVADMVVMAVGEHDMGDARRDLVQAAGEVRIAGEEGIDQDVGIAQVDAEGRMAEPGDFHGGRL